MTVAYTTMWPGIVNRKGHMDSAIMSIAKSAFLTIHRIAAIAIAVALTAGAACLGGIAAVIAGSLSLLLVIAAWKPDRL
jgi:hypothetical protein